jgi:hypothetical protein
LGPDPGRRAPAIGGPAAPQIYGLAWQQASIRYRFHHLEDLPTNSKPAASPLEPDLALESGAGVKLAGETLVLLVNELMRHARRQSRIRYNFYYPRWAMTIIDPAPDPR